MSFDGSRAGTNYFSDMPKELYKRKLSLSNGNSAVSKILNSKQEEVTESLYLNYNFGFEALLCAYKNSTTSN